MDPPINPVLFDKIEFESEKEGALTYMIAPSHDGQLTCIAIIDFITTS